MSKKKKKSWKAKRSLQENLHRQLPTVATEYFHEGRIALAPGATWDVMHTFRLHTKRFRYTLELFREAYGPALDRRVELLKKLQTFLGDMNDCIVTSSMLVTVPGMEAVRESLSRKAELKADKLRAFWANVFDAPGQERLWAGYLGRYACRPPRQPRTRRLTAPEEPVVH